MFRVGQVVKLVDLDHVDYYESDGRAKRGNYLIQGKEYKVLEVNNSPRYIPRELNRSSEPLIAIKRDDERSGIWWVKASAFKPKDSPLKLPEWF